MRTITDTIGGDATIRDAVTLQGMVVGDVVVVAGGYLDLYGTCCRNLKIEKDGVVNLYGTVSGDVTNDGGRLDVHGVINGQLVEIAGHTRVQSGASVAGVRR